MRCSLAGRTPTGAQRARCASVEVDAGTTQRVSVRPPSPYPLRRRLLSAGCAIALAPSVPPLAAQAPHPVPTAASAVALPLDAAAALDCAAARYRGAALRVEARDGGQVQELRWRTPAGNVLRIRLAGPGCRFLEVEGVGQTQARILPGAAR